MKLRLIVTTLWLVVLAVLLSSVSAQAARNVYVTNQGSNSVSQYAIGAGGFLSVLGPVPAGGDDPRSIALSPDGKSAYVTNFFGNTISQYDIDPVSGGLSPKSPATVAAGFRPDSIVVTPDGRSAYVVNVLDDSISLYDIDPVNGALSP